MATNPGNQIANQVGWKVAIVIATTFMGIANVLIGLSYSKISKLEDSQQKIVSELRYHMGQHKGLKSHDIEPWRDVVDVRPLGTQRGSRILSKPF